MTAVLGILAWIVTLAPIVIKLGKWITKIIPKIAPKAATGAATVSIWATIGTVLATSSVLGAVTYFVWSHRHHMYYVAARTVIPMVGYVLSKVVGIVVAYLPSVGANQYFDMFMGFATAFDYATPLTLIIIGYSLSVVVGNFMRALKI